MEEPSRAYDRNAREEPKSENPSTDTDDPTRPLFLRDSDAPNST
jgi:hypothetical protein